MYYVHVYMCVFGLSHIIALLLHALLPIIVDAGSDELTPVDPSRFQVLDIDERCDIRTFVEKHSLIFKTGRGFYEFTKPEKVSDKKEVVLVDKVQCVLIYIIHSQQRD